jgi:hypothetical protein
MKAILLSPHTCPAALVAVVPEVTLGGVRLGYGGQLVIPLQHQHIGRRGKASLGLIAAGDGVSQLIVCGDYGGDVVATDPRLTPHSRH